MLARLVETPWSLPAEPRQGSPFFGSPFSGPSKALVRDFGVLLFRCLGPPFKRFLGPTFRGLGAYDLGCGALGFRAWGCRRG